MRHVDSAPPRLSELLGLAGLFALGLAWLVPNKAYPWVSVWNEAVAAFGLLLLALVPLGRAGAGARARARMAWPLAALALIGIVSVWAQWSFGLLAYAGDAWMVSLYLGLFALAVLTGRALASGADDGRWRTALLLAILLPGLASVGTVLMQWTWANPLVVFVQEAFSDGRPFASLGQPNHANTLFFLALCCALQLRRERVIGPGGALLAVAVLALAMGVSRSRTGLLQLGLLAAWGAWLSVAGRARGEWRWGVAALALGVLWWKAVPWLDGLLQQGLPLRDVANAQGDPRFVYWRAFLEAVWQRPWGGWGWLQTGAAEASFVACRPRELAYHSYTHMLALDWLVWLGLPLGLGLLALLGWWAWRHLPARGAVAGGYWLAAVLGFGIHAMLEYPQAYLYFLLPIGLMMGVVDARHPVHRAIALPRAAYAAIWALLALLAALVMRDAARAITAYTDIRFENARIGSIRRTVEAPSMVLLDQLEGYLAFAAIDVTAPIHAQSLLEYHKPVRRFPFPNLLLRHAVMLEGARQTEAAAREQQLFCDFYGPQECAEAALKWQSWQQEYPGLRLSEFKGRPLAPRCGQAVAR